MKTKKPLHIVAGLAVIFALVLVLNSITGAAPANVANIGLIDMEKITNNLPDYQKLKDFEKDKQTELNLFRQLKYAEYGNKAKDLKQKADEEKKGKTAEEQTAIDSKYSELTQKNADEYQTLLNQKLKELSQIVNERAKAAEEKLKKLIADVAEDKKLSVVLEKGSVLYGGVDITDLVIEKGKKEAEANKNKVK